MSVYILMFSILTGISLTSYAKTIELKKNTRSIFINEKKGWTLGKDLFGMPYVYFSPKENGQRSNISFTDTGANLELEVKSLTTSQKNYQRGRKNWAKKVGATILGFNPYNVSINKHGHKLHRVGVNYIHDHKTYFEKSVYIECRGKILFSKSLRLSQNEIHEKEFSEILSNLDCGGI